jgi:ABC-2 type transport system ATP-binding protein
VTVEKREVVRVAGVVKDFRPGFGLRRKRVLHGVTFDVREGEIFGFVGPNGAGKTPENPYFYPFLTGREILDFYARLSGVDSATRAARVDELLEVVNLSYAADARLRTYSKGMLQRVGVAQALVNDPEIVFFDEPMSGLDPIGRKEIRDVLLALRATGKTVFMTTHILHDVEMICDRVAIIVKGAIRHQGRIEEFLPDATVSTDIVLSELPVELAADLEEKFSLEMRGLGERVELTVAEKQVRDVLEAAMTSGAHVVSVTPHRSSLEEVFLNAVQEEEGSA